MSSVDREVIPVPGDRARIGLILPSSERGLAVSEYDRLLPDGVIALVTRMLLPESTGDDSAVADLLVAMQGDCEHAARLLATSRPSCISFACTSGAFIQGATFDETIVQRIERIADVPATTMARASVEALRKIGAQRVLFFSPYTPDVAAAGVKILKDRGIEVVHETGLNISNDDVLYRLDPWELFDLVVAAYRDARHKAVDAIFVSCGGLRIVQLIDRLERDLGVPCITSNQANAWHSLRLSGIDDSIDGFGALLRDA